MKNIKRKFIKILIPVLLLLCLAALCSCKNNEEPEIVKTDAYISTDGSLVTVYTGTETIETNIFGKVKTREIVFEESRQLVRGTKVTLTDRPEKDEEGNITYERIEIDGETLYIRPGYLVDDYQKSITETVKYVRTPVTMYAQSDDVIISGFAQKGSRLELIGFDYFNEDSSVNMYKVRLDRGNDDISEGYVFAKYLVDTQEAADAVYNEELNGSGVYDYHVANSQYRFDLYGGTAADLDWYPVEKVSIEGNEFPSDARCMRLSVYCATAIDSYIACAEKYNITCFCVDILDNKIGFDSEVAAKYCPTGYANRYEDTEAYEAMIKKLKDRGYYVIGRIVTFNDSSYAKDHPEDCYTNESSGETWPSAFNRNIWEYKVALAVEAVEKLGFNEIQFDYIRFDDYAWYYSEYWADADFKEEYEGESKCAAIQNFLFYACDMLHRAGAYVSADVFGEAAFGYVPANGQYWPAISNVVDAISGMPYVDHFDSDDKTRWEQPYNGIYSWAKVAALLQDHTPTPAVARTWLTGYNAPYWNPYVYYGADKLAEQAQALWDAGLDGGFITWGSCDLDRYYNFSWAWQKDYSN